MQPKKINVYGASGHAKVILDIFGSRDDLSLGYLFDDNDDLERLSGIRVNLPTEEQLLSTNPMIIAIGDNKIRKKVAAQYPHSIYEYVAHASAVISQTASIEEGTVVMAQAVINADVKIGRHAIVNTAAVVEHDCELGDFTHISPKAALAGNVQVGEGTHIGTGAVIIPGIRIGKWCTIGAGAVIIQDVPDGVTVVGNPGKNLTSKT